MGFTNPSTGKPQMPPPSPGVDTSGGWGAAPPMMPMAAAPQFGMANYLMNRFPMTGGPQVSPTAPPMPVETSTDVSPPMTPQPSLGAVQNPVQNPVGVGPGGETNTNQNVPGGQAPTPSIPSTGWLHQQPPASSPYTPPAGLGQRMPFMNRRWGANG